MERFYRVQKNDTVLSVSEKFKVPVSKIIKDNELNSEIREGDIIYIESGKTAYTVLATDTVESICLKFGVNRDDFVKKNGEYVFFGETVIIP